MHIPETTHGSQEPSQENASKKSLPVTQESENQNEVTQADKCNGDHP